MGKKSTVATVEQRVTKVYALLLRGASRSSIFQYAADQGWGLSDRMVDNYIAKANEQIVSQANLIRENALEKAIAGRNELLLDAWQARQYHTALAAMDKRDQLLGLFNKVEVTPVESESTIVVLPEKDAND